MQSRVDQLDRSCELGSLTLRSTWPGVGMHTDRSLRFVQGEAISWWSILPRARSASKLHAPRGQPSLDPYTSALFTRQQPGSGGIIAQ